mgnify:CR=1 FL=1
MSSPAPSTVAPISRQPPPGCPHGRDCAPGAPSGLGSPTMLVASPGLPGLAALHHPSDLARFPLVGLATIWSGGLPLQRGDVSSLRVTLPTRKQFSVVAGIV